MTNPIDKAQLRALAEAATPGPWKLVRHTSAIGKGTPGATDDWTIYGDEHKSIAYEGSHPRVGDPDFIAAASPATIIALLDELAMREQSEREAWRYHPELEAERARLAAEMEALRADAARWRYSVKIGGNQTMTWLDVYADWDGDGYFVDAIDAAMAEDARAAASIGAKGDADG